MLDRDWSAQSDLVDFAKANTIGKTAHLLRFRKRRQGIRLSHLFESASADFDLLIQKRRVR